jgi:hypothetical protein
MTIAREQSSGCKQSHLDFLFGGVAVCLAEALRQNAESLSAHRG